VRALDSTVVKAVWAAVEGHLPQRPPDTHPLGCHRPRVPDRVCFTAILTRLVTGCSWHVAAYLTGGVSATTLRARRTEWVHAGVFDKLLTEALTAYDRIIGLDLSEVAVDGSLHKAPCGGEGTGKNPTDRGKLGWKWSLATERWGIPIGWVIAGANRNDSILLEPTLQQIARRGLLVEIGTLHLDRGYDSDATLQRTSALGLHDVICAKRRPPGKPKTKVKVKQSLGMRWPVERTNSWLSNFGQLRRNTDRYENHRLGQLALAIALILTIKIAQWAKRWNT
jgi:transposase